MYKFSIFVVLFLFLLASAICGTCCCQLCMTRWFLYSWPPRFQHEPNLPGFTPQHCHISYDLFTHFLLKGSISSRMCAFIYAPRTCYSMRQERECLQARWLLTVTFTFLTSWLSRCQLETLGKSKSESTVFCLPFSFIRLVLATSGRVFELLNGSFPKIHILIYTSALRNINKSYFLNTHIIIIYDYYCVVLTLLLYDITECTPPPHLPFCIPCHFIMQFMPCRVLYKPPGSIMSFDFFLS